MRHQKKTNGKESKNVADTNAVAHNLKARAANREALVIPTTSKSRVNDSSQRRSTVRSLVNRARYVLHRYQQLYTAIL